MYVFASIHKHFYLHIHTFHGRVHGTYEHNPMEKMRWMRCVSGFRSPQDFSLTILLKAYKVYLNRC